MGQSGQNKKALSIPEVSIIIPMYNVECYIGECLQSLLSQTYGNYEILCVDDGSDDHTVEIVREYMASDERIRLYEQPHCGRAGVARNFGIEKAKGDYFLFLDSDDFFENRMLECVLDKIKQDDAEICLFGARKYFDDTKKFKKYNAIYSDYIPEEIPFEGRSYGYIFNVCSASPWNKLFKKSLIDEYQIRFMPLHRCNDVFFVYFAMAVARRITILNEVFVNYRQSSNSLQATNDRSPWDWYEALCELRRRLKECGLYEDVEQSFMNYCLGLSLYNLNSLKTSAVFCQFYERAKKEFFEDLGLFAYDHTKYYSVNEQKCKQLEEIRQYDVGTYLFNENVNLRNEKNNWNLCANRAKKELKETKECTTYKLGQGLLFIPKKVKAAIKKEQKSS